MTLRAQNIFDSGRDRLSHRSSFVKGERCKLTLRLLDPDGNQISPPGSDGSLTPIGHEGEIEAGRPPGLAPGSMLNAALAVRVPSMPLTSGRYEWRLDIGDQTFSESFTVQSLKSFPDWWRDMK